MVVWPGKDGRVGAVSQLIIINFLFLDAISDLIKLWADQRARQADSRSQPDLT